MNTKIKLAYFAIILSILSLIPAFWLGRYGDVFVLFPIGYFAYSCLALYFFKNDKTVSHLKTFLESFVEKGSSKAFFGSFVAMVIMSIIYLFFVVRLSASAITEFFWGWQIFVIVVGVIPAMCVGAIIGKIFDSFSNKKSNS